MGAPEDNQHELNKHPCQELKNEKSHDELLEAIEFELDLAKEAMTSEIQDVRPSEYGGLVVTFINGDRCVLEVKPLEAQTFDRGGVARNKPARR